MAKLEGFRIKNFKALKDVTLGRLWNQPKQEPLSPITAVIGKNGVGKSTLIDAFSFLADALKSGVEEACCSRGRGGFERIRTQGQTEPIGFEFYYRQDRNARPITYEIAIDIDSSARPYVLTERLGQRRKGQKRGRPLSFLVLNSGKGVVWKGDAEGRQFDREQGDFDLFGLMESIKSGEATQESKQIEFVELNDPRRLGIAVLGSFKQHPRISELLKFIERGRLIDFTPEAARSLPLAGPQKHLDIHGDNLGNVVQFMEREHPKRFRAILSRIAEMIPGIDKIAAEKTNDGRLLLRFNDKGFEDPFYSRQMSDGTLKVLAYLLLLEDPTPPPFLCIEGLENSLHHKLLEFLAMQFRRNAADRKGGSQVFLTTHHPYLVDALEPNEVWILEKGSDGFSVVSRASDDAIVNSMVAEGLPLGGLWFSDYLDAS
jgi:predicted ATPase